MYKSVSKSVKLAAYTLFEIIIVIVVVGFLAVLVIQPFMSFPQKQESVVRLKKAYSEFNGVLLKLPADSGCVDDLRCTGVFDFGTTDQSLGEALAKYFKVSKTCGTMPNIGCMPSSVSTHYDGATTRSNFDETGYRFITNNGTVFSITNYSNNCMVDSTSTDEDDDVKGHNGKSGCSNDQNGDANGNNGKANTGADKNGSGNGNNGNSKKDTTCEPASVVPEVSSMSQVCGSVYIDTNGPLKGPNNFGRDIFAFWITNGKGAMLFPMGAQDDGGLGWWKDPKTEFARYCYPSHTDGAWCAGRIMEEGWQMNY